MMGARTHRNYRQSDELYDLIGRLAARLGTSRTAVLELAVHALEERAEGDVSPLVEKAREIDQRRYAPGLEAAMDARVKMGLARRKVKPEPVGS